MEPPLITEHLCKQCVTPACPFHAQTVERRHHTCRPAFFYCNLKRIQINLTHWLFVRPDENTVILSVCLLIIYCKMFHIAINAFFARSFDYTGCKLTGQQTVFTVILPISSCKRRAMDINRRSVPSGIRQPVSFFISGKPFFSYQFTHFLCQLDIPCRTHHTFCLISASTIDNRFRQKACKPAWPVWIHSKRFSHHSVHTFYFACTESTESHQIFHLIKGNLI